MIIKGFLILSLFLMGIGSWADFALAKSKNSGLGPLELRNQYPLTHQFLSLHPENTSTQKKGKSRLSYHIAVANTFVNTQGPVSYTHLRAHETLMNLVCRLLLEKKKK